MSELDDLLDPGITEGNNPGQQVSQQTISNSAGVLVLGIISIAGCWLWGLPALVCGIIALVMYKKVKATYLTNTAKYERSYKNAQAGMICAIIGVCLSALMTIYMIFILLVFASIEGARF
jgi:membrane glycosyltransferase